MDGGRRVQEGTSSVTDAFGNKVSGTSVKVHHAPGGASSFSLGGGYGGEGSVLDGKKNQGGAVAGAAAPANNSEEKKVDEVADNQGAASAAAADAGTGAVGGTRRVQEGTASVTDAFGNKVSGTSVKVHAPPGGYSSIQF